RRGAREDLAHALLLLERAQDERAPAHLLELGRERRRTFRVGAPAAELRLLDEPPGLERERGGLRRVGPARVRGHGLRRLPRRVARDAPADAEVVATGPAAAPLVR